MVKNVYYLVVAQGADDRRAGKNFKQISLDFKHHWKKGAKHQKSLVVSTEEGKTLHSHTNNYPSQRQDSKQLVRQQFFKKKNLGLDELNTDRHNHATARHT